MTTSPIDRVLPGEAGPLPMRFGGEPITLDEALGVARRRARAARTRRRARIDEGLPEELPAPGVRPVQSGYRLPPRMMLLVRAKAEMESTTVTSVITEALTAYVDAPPRAAVQYALPKAQ